MTIVWVLWLPGLDPTNKVLGSLEDGLGKCHTNVYVETWMKLIDFNRLSFCLQGEVVIVIWF